MAAAQLKMTAMLRGWEEQLEVMVKIIFDSKIECIQLPMLIHVYKLVGLLDLKVYLVNQPSVQRKQVLLNREVQAFSSHAVFATSTYVFVVPRVECHIFLVKLHLTVMRCHVCHRDTFCVEH